MQGFLIFIHTLLSVVLILIILMQASQGGGLSGTFGSTATNSIFGGRTAATMLSKLTGWLAVGFIVLAILISLVTAPSAPVSDSLLRQSAEEQGAVPALDLSAPANSQSLDLEQ